MCWKYSRSTDIHSQTEIISQTFKSKTNKHQIKLGALCTFCLRKHENSTTAINNNGRILNEQSILLGCLCDIFADFA